jgi:hypothetical protein
VLLNDCVALELCCSLTVLLTKCVAHQMCCSLTAGAPRLCCSPTVSLINPCCPPRPPQEKDALPQGLLSSSYKEGVVFVTYSLLAMSSQVPGVKQGPLAKALHVSGLGPWWPT